MVKHVRQVRDADADGAGACKGEGGGFLAAQDVSQDFAGEEAPPAAPSTNAARKPADDEMRVIEAAVKACQTPLAFVCMDGGIFDSNLAFNQLLGYQSSELLGNTIYMHTTPTDIAPLMSAVCNLITDKIANCNLSIKLQRKDGYVVPCSFDMSVQRFSGDQMYIVVYVQRDSGDPSTQAHALHLSLDRLSLSDVAAASTFSEPPASAVITTPNILMPVGAGNRDMSLYPSRGELGELEGMGVMGAQGGSAMFPTLQQQQQVFVTYTLTISYTPKTYRDQLILPILLMHETPLFCSTSTSTSTSTCTSTCTSTS